MDLLLVETIKITMQARTENLHTILEPTFVSKVLLDHSLAHSVVYYQWLFLYNHRKDECVRDHTACKA